MTPTSYALGNMARPPRPLIVAVYEFPDQTGALKPTTSGTTAVDYSKAVTQGATSVLVDTLNSVGGGAWFSVVERSRVDDLLRERTLIQDTYSAVKRTPESIVSPLHFAEYLFEGGITSFDATIVSGGLGATYLGLGPTSNYLKNLVTVTLRLVEVRTGKVITSVTTSKSILSVTYDLSITKYITVGGNFLDVHGSFSHVEPTQIAVREAIEAAVYELMRQTYALGLWKTNSPEVLPAHLMAAAIRNVSKTKPDTNKPKESRPARPAQLVNTPRQALLASNAATTTNYTSTDASNIFAVVPDRVPSLPGSTPIVSGGTFH